MNIGTRKILFFAIVSLSLSICLGCGESGPANYSLSGTVTHNGNPVPSGEVFLRPEIGPGGFAMIKDGKYETIDGHGFQGGKSKIT